MICRRKRLAKMISTMRERMSAKLGNCNDNAFKMRKLFKVCGRFCEMLAQQLGWLGYACRGHLVAR